MLPISALPGARAKALSGICFDVDDTVTTGGVLDPAAYAAMHRLRDAGLLLVAVTGRPLGWAELMARQWPVHAAIGENGAGYISRRDRQIVCGYWDDQDTRARQQRELDALCARVREELPHVQEASDAWARRCDRAFDVGELDHVSPADVERLAALIRSLGAQCSVSSVHAHAQLGDHDKASGVARALLDLFGIESSRAREDFLFIGDSGNDAAAFAWFATTVGVANVTKHLARLPVSPTYVTSAEHGAGFAEMAHRVLEERAS